MIDNFVILPTDSRFGSVQSSQNKDALILNCSTTDCERPLNEFAFCPCWNSFELYEAVLYQRTDQHARIKYKNLGAPEYCLHVMKLLAFLLGVALLTDLVTAADDTIQLTDIRGKSHTPLVAGLHKGVVLVFVSPFCPTANTLTPEASKIAADYGDRFAFYFVEADAGISIADARKHAETLEIKAPLLLDPQQLLVRRTKAKTTPEAVVLGPKGETLYQGRINDLYVNQTRKLKEPKTNDLRAALDAISAGQPVAVTTTKAIGCSITVLP
jgi:hypothetical protein